MEWETECPDTGPARGSGKARRFIIAGGGTGGHLFPGIAVARELEDRFGGAEILFVVGRKPMEKHILERYGYCSVPIRVEGLKGRGWKKGLGVMSGLPRSLFQSAAIIREFPPALVLGMGGYSAGPICVAARLMGVPTAVHEQNSYPGLTNRLLSRVVDRVFISFEESRSHLKCSRVVLTGNPVRKELLAFRRKKPNDRGVFTILAVGGSQGAAAINRSLAEALSHLNRSGRHPRVIHQTGEADYGRVKEDYGERGLDAEIVPFIEDMRRAYERADMVVSRAGATTISELAALAMPSILIPYPYAANQHQEINARSLVRRGGAEMILERDLTGEVMAGVLVKYMDDAGALVKMGEAAGKMGRLEAAGSIVDQLAAMMRE